MAESLRSLKQHFDDQLTCSVCLDQYTNPKTLPCHHSFCLECIQLLPKEIKDEKYYISCPTCRVDHLVPQGGAANLPNAFQINSFLELQRKLTIREQIFSSTTCPKHNDPLKAYCETCCRVICCECTISEEHNTHNFHLISKCYPKHHQKIQESLDLVKHKTADIDTAVTDLATREREVLQQGQQLKEQINTHAQQIISNVQRSRTRLSQQVDTIVQQKTQVLAAQRHQAQTLQIKLETCQKRIEHSLKEWTEQQILTEKHTMMDKINTAIQNVDPAVLQPKEKVDLHIEFANTDAWKIKEIGLITSTTYANASLNASPLISHHSSRATLTLQPLPSSTSTLSSQSKFTPNPTAHSVFGVDKISTVDDSDGKAQELEELMEEVEQLRGELEQKDKELAECKDRINALEIQIEEYAGTIDDQSKWFSVLRPSGLRGKRSSSIVGMLGLQQTQGVKVVELHKGPTGLGMLLKGSRAKDSNVPITVKEVLPGGVAYKSNKINIDDEILEANGVSFEGLDYAEAISVIKSLPQGTVRLVLLDKHFVTPSNDQ